MYILHREDLVALKPGRERASLDTLVEWALRRLPGKAVRASEARCMQILPTLTVLVLHNRSDIPGLSQSYKIRLLMQ